MPRKIDHEAKLLADLERLRAEKAKLYATEQSQLKKIAQERYRKQRAWEAQVGRLAWIAGLNTLDLSTIAHLLNRLTPADLLGSEEPASVEQGDLVLSGNS